MPDHHSINYIELPMQDATKIKNFYGRVFGWSFEDYGPDYVAIIGAEIDGGFNGTEGLAPAESGVLVVLYSDRLEESLEAVKDAGGEITKAIFSFPGGRRFHFKDTDGNHLAVWTHTEE